MNSDTLLITTIQTNLHWEDKAANLQMLRGKINALAGKTEVVVLPEMFSTGFTMNTALAETMDGPTVAWMQETAAKNKIILTGSIIVKQPLPPPLLQERGQGGEVFNRLVWMLPNGQYGYYDKRHLFGYAGEDNYYTAGSKRLIASVKGWKINLQVCYDLRFPVWSRQSPCLPGKMGQGDKAGLYDILVNVANWPAKRSLAWKTLLQARAIENQCYVVGVNRVGEDGNGHHYDGDTMVIDPLGTILYHKKQEEDVHTIILQKQALHEIREKLPFLKDGDGFQIEL